jgi:hypothetical protein
MATTQACRSALTDKPTRVEHNRQPHRVRLPGFVADDDVGIGDVVTRATHAFGIRRCGSCERRAAMLNRWLVFSARRSR